MGKEVAGDDGPGAIRMLPWLGSTHFHNSRRSDEPTYHYPPSEFRGSAHRWSPNAPLESDRAEEVKNKVQRKYRVERMNISRNSRSKRKPYPRETPTALQTRRDAMTDDSMDGLRIGVMWQPYEVDAEHLKVEVEWNNEGIGSEIP